jgi:DNA-binding NarL/FixJ family response regulator
MSELIKILIVDDHKVMRDSLEREFCPENGFDVVGSIRSAAAAETFCVMNRPDVVIMDVCTEFGASGLEAAGIILKKLPEIKVIVTSGFDEVTYMPRAKEIGAHAFVYKIEGVEYYREVALRVLNGEVVFPEQKNIPVSHGEAPFTPKEMEVLRLLCQYKTSQDIAAELFISDHTVRKHIENMRQKSGMKSAMDLVIYVLSNGWVNPNY